jgi:predicted lipoprotein with Yx(FWY)xxD motif
MKIVTGLLVAAILAMVAFVVVGPRQQQSTQPQATAEVAVMPAGITFQIVGGQVGMSVMGAFKGYPVITNEKHRTIYVSDKDEANKINCTGDCAKDFVPLAAPVDAKPSGFWNVVTRGDGTKQWSRHGKPLYTYAGDKNAGDVKGASVESWHWVLNKAMDGTPLPDGIVTDEIIAAGGQVFVDARGKTIYAFTGDIKADSRPCAPGATDCADQFRPLVAPQLATKLGDFTAMTRPDGTKQWAYQSHPLYTYDGDAIRGESNGRVVDPRWQVALAEKYFQPEGIKIGINVRGVDYLTDANGMTVYARDRFHFQVGGFSLRHGQDGIPQLGQFLGTSTCTGDCLKTWIPVAAPADFKPSGYWSVFKRKDGTAQWGFQGYALYTYTNDKKPGDETGHDSFDISLGKTLPAVPQNPIDAVAALYWREVMP